MGTQGRAFQAPTGTRDFYPADLLRRRYIEKLWRDTSIRHGFEEIDGPTFEDAELYAVKSGEGILGELFQAFSGKSPEEVARVRETGRAPFALRPEFTPTLARMYAARAGSLPRPTKWFWMQNCFRAERPQRGRLREFGQWNCDIIGADNEPEAQARATASFDSDLIACIVGCFTAAGLTPTDAHVHVSDRMVVSNILLNHIRASSDRLPQLFDRIDSFKKDPAAALPLDLHEYGIESAMAPYFWEIIGASPGCTNTWEFIQDKLLPKRFVHSIEDLRILDPIRLIWTSLRERDIGEWTSICFMIVRGLAYYTGTVFEVHSGAERAIAGGGRYDNLIELFGGPPTPAVGFGMGDVVLSLVLQDRGLMPDEPALLDILSRPGASLRPDAFVIPAGQTPQDQEQAGKAVRPLVARLRRGTESPAWRAGDAAARKPWDSGRYALAPVGARSSEGGAPPLHARHSYKATRNIGKLLKEASACRARFAVILESGEDATLKNLDTGEQDAARTRLADVPAELARRLGRA